MFKMELGKTFEDLCQNQCSEKEFGIETGLSKTKLLNHNPAVEKNSNLEQINIEKDVLNFAPPNSPETCSVEDLWLTQCLEQRPKTEIGLLKTELWIHKLYVEQKSNHEELSNTEKDVSGMDFEASPHIWEKNSSMEDLCQNQYSEKKLKTEIGLPKTELLNHKPSVEQKYNVEKDVYSIDFSTSPNTSEVAQPTPHGTSVDIFRDDELDFLEVQKANNIMRAAYKEFMEIAAKANSWILSIPAVGSVKEIQEMFHTTPPHGFRVECSVESAILRMPSSLLISMMMDAEQWASTFSRIICHGSDEEALRPLSRFLFPMDFINVKLVNAQFRLPAEFLPRWSTCFLRFKKRVMENTYAIFDVSTDYFEDASSNSTQRFEYKRRPSGVIIRERGFCSEVIWVENAVVQEIDVPENVCPTSTSNFTLSAQQWVSILSHNLKRRESKYLIAKEVLDETQDIRGLFKIAENMQRVYLETVNPFPSERTSDLFSNGKIRILRDMRENYTDDQNDYIASSTIHVPETPIKLFLFLSRNNVRFQWSSIKSQEQVNMVVAYFSEDESNCIHLLMDTETGYEEDFEGHEFFLHEASMNEFCSFVISSRMTESDLYLSLLPRYCGRSDFLKPSGFAIMPAGPGGLQSKTSLVTICLRRELENMEADQAIEAMSSHMDAFIDEITNFLNFNR